MSPDKTLESLLSKLQSIPEQEVEMDTLQETYRHLRAAFAYELFDLKHASPDHYSWLLMNHDANGSLDRLVLAHKVWQSDKNNHDFWLTYKQDLDDFKWIITTAMNCKP